MRTIKTLLAFALAAFFASPAISAVVYDDSGSGGSGSAVITDTSGNLQVDYDSYEWAAYYDDVGFAYFTYTLYASSGTYAVFAVYGGPPPITGWNFYSTITDNLAAGHPMFLDAFWVVAPL